MQKKLILVAVTVVLGGCWKLGQERAIVVSNGVDKEGHQVVHLLCDHGEIQIAGKNERENAALAKKLPGETLHVFYESSRQGPRHELDQIELR